MQCWSLSKHTFQLKAHRSGSIKARLVRAVALGQSLNRRVSSLGLPIVTDLAPLDSPAPHWPRARHSSPLTSFSFIYSLFSLPRRESFHTHLYNTCLSPSPHRSALHPQHFLSAINYFHLIIGFCERGNTWGEGKKPLLSKRKKCFLLKSFIKSFAYNVNQINQKIQVLELNESSLKKTNFFFVASMKTEQF